MQLWLSCCYTCWEVVVVFFFFSHFLIIAFSLHTIFVKLCSMIFMHFRQNSQLQPHLLNLFPAGNSHIAETFLSCETGYLSRKLFIHLLFFPQLLGYFVLFLFRTLKEHIEVSITNDTSLSASGLWMDRSVAISGFSLLLGFQVPIIHMISKEVKPRGWPLAGVQPLMLDGYIYHSEFVPFVCLTVPALFSLLLFLDYLLSSHNFLVENFWTFWKMGVFVHIIHYFLLKLFSIFL